MAGGVGHMGGLTNPHPWRGRCRADYSNTGGPPLPRKRAPYKKGLIFFFRESTHWTYNLDCSVQLLTLILGYSACRSGLPLVFTKLIPQ